jgi:hypothetical protein
VFGYGKGAPSAPAGVLRVPRDVLLAIIDWDPLGKVFTGVEA